MEYEWWQAEYEDPGQNYFDYDVSWTRGPHPAWNWETSPVGSFPANGYGLYDMAGNLAEWCWDLHGGSGETPLSGTDPRGPAEGSFRRARGGGHDDWADSCRVFARSLDKPDVRSANRGFRLVRSAAR